MTHTHWEKIIETYIFEIPIALCILLAHIVKKKNLQKCWIFFFLDDSIPLNNYNNKSENSTSELT